MYVQIVLICVDTGNIVPGQTTTYRRIDMADCRDAINCFEVSKTIWHGDTQFGLYYTSRILLMDTENVVLKS